MQAVGQPDTFDNVIPTKESFTRWLQQLKEFHLTDLNGSIDSRQIQRIGAVYDRAVLEMGTQVAAAVDAQKKKENLVNLAKKLDDDLMLVAFDVNIVQQLINN